MTTGAAREQNEDKLLYICYIKYYMKPGLIEIEFQTYQMYTHLFEGENPHKITYY